jgi:hypothetical protein
VIVQGSAVDNEPSTAEGTDFVATEVEISPVLKGSAEELLQVRQHSDEYLTNSYPVAPVLDAGTEYVLYLRPFELVPGEPPDERVVLGAGAFEVDGIAIIVPEQAQYYSGFPQVTEIEETYALASQSG